MRFVQLLLTDEQSELVAAALRDAEKSLAASGDPADFGGEPEVLEDIAQLGRLGLLFQDASENPAKYTPTGENAATVRSIVKRAKGRAQVPSLRKKRSGRSQRRRAERHIFRRNREYIEQFNAAQEAYDRDRQDAEAAAAELAERIKDQPKYSVTDGYGNVLMAGIPAEFVLYEDGESLWKPPLKLHVVGDVDA